MIDYADTSEVQKMANELVSYAKKYAEARNKASEAKYNLNIILANNINVLREKKSNIGYETALIMLMDLVPESRTYYKDLMFWEAKYKGLERIQESMNSQLILAMSLIKNTVKES